MVRWSAGAGRIVVRESAPLVVKLFGIPFLGIGLYLGRIFVGGIVHRELTVAGWITLPVFAIAFLVPGFLLAFASGRTVVDGAARVVVNGRDFLFFRLETRTAVPAQGAVEVRHEVRRTGGSGRAGEIDHAHLFCPVEVTGGPEPLRIAEIDGKEGEKAAALGRDVAGLLGLPLRDLRKAPGESVEEAGSADAD